FEFTAARSILVREVRTNWAYTEREWRVITVNSSGYPVAPRVTFTWPDGKTSEISSDEGFVPLEGRDYAHVFRATIPGSVPGLFRPANGAYPGLGGGLLPQRDLRPLAGVTLGPYRRDGKEFVALAAEIPLEALTIVVSVPPVFAPEPKDVEVFYERLGPAD